MAVSVALCYFTHVIVCCVLFGWGGSTRCFQEALKTGKAAREGVRSSACSHMEPGVLSFRDKAELIDSSLLLTNTPEIRAAFHLYTMFFSQTHVSLFKLLQNASTIGK